MCYTPKDALFCGSRVICYKPREASVLLFPRIAVQSLMCVRSTSQTDCVRHLPCIGPTSCGDMLAPRL